MPNDPSPDPEQRIQPSRHSTDEVDEKLDDVQHEVDVRPGAESPAIKPNRALGEDGKPLTDTPENPRL